MGNNIYITLKDDEKMGELEFGDSTYNMSLQTLKRIDDLLQVYHQYKRIEFYKGNPLHNDILRILESIYTEVRPQLKEDEKKYGDAYRIIFKKKYPIKVEGDITTIPKATLPIMEEWMDWLMEMLYSHKMLMAISDDPGDVIE